MSPQSPCPTHFEISNKNHTEFELATSVFKHPLEASVRQEMEQYPIRVQQDIRRQAVETHTDFLCVFLSSEISCVAYATPCQHV